MKHRSWMWAVLVLAAAWCAAGEEAKATPKVTEWTGTAGCAKCAFSDKKADKCAAALKTADAVYYLKAAENADQATKDSLFRIELGTLKGDATVRGTLAEADGKKTITVESVTVKSSDPPPPPPKSGKKGGKKGR